MANEKKDQSVLSHIDQLVKEEERLYGKSSLTGDDHVRLGELKVELDRCWDLLRKRRALREFGEDRDTAKVRPAKIESDCPWLRSSNSPQTNRGSHFWREHHPP